MQIYSEQHLDLLGAIDKIVFHGSFCSYFEQISGSQQNWNRDYDPAIGRYLQSDPIGLGDGLNTYAYVYGNPVAYTDRTGQFGPLAGCAFGAAPAVIGGGYDWYVGAVSGESVFWGAVVGCALGAIGGQNSNQLVQAFGAGSGMAISSAMTAADALGDELPPPPEEPEDDCPKGWSSPPPSGCTFSRNDEGGYTVTCPQFH
jgi:RHS repeat-associated protein